MVDALGGAFLQIFSSASMFYLVGGVVLGLVVGVLPGFGGTVGLAILLPFVYGLDPASGLALMIGVMAVICTADTFPAVLIGIPGSVGSQATVLDGYELAKQGQAGRALAAAFTASLFGGLIGAVILTAIIQIARPVVLSFGTGEMLMLAGLGLSMVGLLAGRSFIKGLIAAMLGLLIGMVGMTPTSNEYRMEFDTLYLSNGVPLMVIAISIFAIPEIVDLLRRDTSVSGEAKLTGSWISGVKDALRNKFLILRCAGIGALVGMLPGLGASVVDWIAYGHAVQSAKDKDNFGKGDIRGVLAPESANNAKEGGSLVPTLIFGIPGSGATAVLLGGMILLGVEPGLNMIKSDIETVYLIIWSLAIANLIGAALCVLLAQPISKLTRVNVRLLAPFLIVLLIFATYQSSRSWGDLIFAMAIGTFAIYMRRFGYPRPALMIGFVLSTGVETNFYQTHQFYGLSVFERPIFLTLLAVCTITLIGGLRLLKRQNQAAADNPRARANLGQYVMAITMACLAAFALFFTKDLTWQGSIFTQIIAIPMLVLALILIWRLMQGGVRNPDMEDLDLPSSDGTTEYKTGVWFHLGWITGLLLAAALVGYWLAIGIFLFAFLSIRSGLTKTRSALVACVVLAAVALLSYLLHLYFPQGLIQEIWRLPFPLA